MASNQTAGVSSVGEDNNLTPHASNISANYFKFLEEALVSKQWRSNIKFKAVIPSELMFIYNLPPIKGFVALYPLCDFIQTKSYSLNSSSSYQFDLTEFNSANPKGITKIKQHIIEECQQSSFIITGRVRSRSKRMHRKIII